MNSKENIDHEEYKDISINETKFKLDMPDVQASLERNLECGEDWAINIIEYLLASGIYNKVSDIHLEPFSDEFKVKFRKDGILRTVAGIHKKYEDNLVTRLKVICKLVVYRKRIPQEGRLRIIYKKKETDLRFSFFPTIHGEKIVIRFMNTSEPLRDFDELGIPDGLSKDIKKLLEHNQGTILLTGPAGSGKTTTMYAALKYIQKQKKDSLNIMTIEDPVEYDLGTICQSQVDPVAGITFSSGLKAILRQDPDVIMIGEIRDRDTAEIAIRAGLTGHLIISTVHSRTSLGVFNRLINLEMEPYMVVSSIAGIISQRLVRKICEKCSYSYKPSKEILSQLPDNLKIKKISFRKGKGCSSCNMTGYNGRIGIFEFLSVDDEIRDSIVKNVQTKELINLINSKGIKNIYEDGLNKVKQGMTTIEEIIRVI